MKSVRTMSTWRDAVKRDRCRDRLAAVKSCNRPSYRVACKRIVVNRNCLTRSEHTEMLSTPKGYLWTGARGLNYVLMRDCKRTTDGVRRRHAKTVNDEDAMWQEFVKQFLLIAKGRLSPTTKTILPKILTSKKIISDPKWSNYPNTQAKLCRFFSNLNPECNSSEWKQDFLQSLSSLIFDYIVQVLYCDRITKKNKLLTSKILQNINKITQEHGSLQPSPDSYVQGVQIFIANILSPWLAKSTTDFCQSANADLLIKSKINKEFHEQEPNKRHARNDSKNIYYRPSNKTPVISTSHYGHKNKFKIIKKINCVKSKSNVNKTDVNEANNVRENIENKHSKVNNGLKVQNGNRSKIKSVTNRVKTKQNRTDAVNNTISISSAEKEVKTKKVKFPKLKIHRNKNNNNISSKSKLMSSKITNNKSNNNRNGDESKKRYNEKRLKTQHGRKRDIIGKNGRSSNEKPLEPDNTYALDENKAINQIKDSTDVNENRLESDRENNNVIDTDHKNDGEIISIKSDLLKMLNGIIKHDKVSSTDDKKTNKKTVKRSKSKNLPRINDDKLASKLKIRKSKTNGKLTRTKSKSIKSKITDEKSSNIRNSDETKKRLKENELKTQYDRKNDKIRKDSGPSNGELLERKSQIKYDDTYALDDNEETVKNKDSTNEKSNVNENGQNNVIGTDQRNHGETITVGSDDRKNNPNYNNDINNIDKSSIKLQIKYDDTYALDDNKGTINSNNSVNREPNVNENRLENDNVIDTDRENRGETIAVESDDCENNPDDGGNDSSTNINNENNNKTPSTKPEVERFNADQLNCTQSYDDIRTEQEFESCVSDEINAFLKKLSTNCNKGELKEICYERFSNNARMRFTVDKTGNEISTDDKKCDNRNLGIVYRICKRDGSNYSVRKTILPTRENGDPAFTVDDPAMKAKLIMRKINEVDNID